MKQKEKTAFTKMQDEKNRKSRLTDTELDYLKSAGLSKKELNVLKTQKANKFYFVKK